MASRSPGWCKHCGGALEQAERTPRRAREFCRGACRTAFNRQARLRAALAREIGLIPQQTARLLDLFRVAERRPAREKRDAATARSDGA